MKNILAGIVFVGLTVFLLRETFPVMSDDFSKKTAYHFFDVPITKNMAEKLSQCKSYNRNYKYPLFKTIWVPYTKGRFKLKINPMPDGYCRIVAKNPHYHVGYDIPVEVAKEIGRLMLSNCFSEEYDLSKLKQFIGCIDEKIYYSNDGQYVVDALKKIETYLAHWRTKDTNQILKCMRKD